MLNLLPKIMLNVISEFNEILVFFHGIKAFFCIYSAVYNFEVDTILHKQNTAYLICTATCKQVSQMTFSTNATPFSEGRLPKQPTCIKEQLRNFKVPVASQSIYWENDACKTFHSTSFKNNLDTSKYLWCCN